MERIIAGLNTTWNSRALCAALVLFPLWLSGCADDKKTDTPAANTFDLAVSVTGSGQVTSNPAGIACGSDCAETLDAESSVTLTAVPANGFTFSNWSGDCNGSTTSCDLTLSQHRAATATFTATTGATGTTTLTWTAPTIRADSSTPISLSEVTGYIIYYGTSNASLTSTIIVTGGATTEYRVTGLPTGVTCYFQISAVDLDGIEGARSAMIGVPL